MPAGIGYVSSQEGSSWKQEGSSWKQEGSSWKMIGDDLLWHLQKVPPGWPSGSFQEWRSLIFEPRADQDIFFGKFPDLEVSQQKTLGASNGSSGVRC